MDMNECMIKLENLEHQMQRIRLTVGIFVALSTLLVAFVAFIAAQSRNVLESREFLLRDKSGQIVARLGSQSIGTCFEILGKTKEALAELCAGDDSGSDLSLMTRHGESRAYLSAGGKAYEAAGQHIPPSLIISQEGKGIVSATVGPNDKQGLGGIADDRSAAPAEPAIKLLDANGKIIWTSP